LVIVGLAAETDFLAFKMDWKGSRILRLGTLPVPNTTASTSAPLTLRSTDRRRPISWCRHRHMAAASGCSLRRVCAPLLVALVRTLLNEAAEWCRTAEVHGVGARLSECSAASVGAGRGTQNRVGSRRLLGSAEPKLLHEHVAAAQCFESWNAHSGGLLPLRKCVEFMNAPPGTHNSNECQCLPVSGSA
jgi:hypothetical protein